MDDLKKSQRSFFPVKGSKSSTTHCKVPPYSSLKRHSPLSQPTPFNFGGYDGSDSKVIEDEIKLKGKTAKALLEQNPVPYNDEARHPHTPRVTTMENKYNIMAITRFAVSVSSAATSVGAAATRQFSSSSSSTTPHQIQFFYNDVYKVSLPSTSKFPMDKYAKIRIGLEEELKSKGVMFFVSPFIEKEELVTTHSEQYVTRFLTGQLTERENRVIGFPYSEAGVCRSLSSVGGTVAAMRSALSNNNGFKISAHIKNNKSIIVGQRSSVKGSSNLVLCVVLFEQAR